MARLAGLVRFAHTRVYFDHPVAALDEHTLNIDFLDPAGGPSAQVAVELGRESAVALAPAILRTLESVPDL